MGESWQAIAEKKRRQLREAIPPEWRLPEGFVASLQSQAQKPNSLIELGVVEKSGILSETELYITGKYSANELLESLTSGKLKAIQVVTAYCKRAAIAQQLTSCMTEMFFDMAVQRAKWLDEYLEKHGKPFGPLHGLPLSVKDTFNVMGGQATVGYVGYLKDPPATTNSALVQLLHDQGAVIFAKTNTPQGMMTVDTENNIFGRTLNPLNTALNVGGSSGGEGALVAMRGTPLGVANDFGGSIRIPAIFLGLYAFKPTADRVPYAGQFNWTGPGLTGQPRFVASAGPIAHSVADLEAFMRYTVGRKSWEYDADAATVPWRAVDSKKKLRIGLLPEDEVYPLHPPVRRAINSAVEALEKAGHTIVRIPADPTRDFGLGCRLAYQLIILMQTFGGSKRDLFAETGEPPVPSVAMRAHPLDDGPFPVRPDLPLPETISGLHNAMLAYINAWKQAFVDADVDVLLVPGTQCVAPKFNTMGLPVYTILWNLVNFPACIIPYGEASKELDSEPMTMNARFTPDYDPEAMDGMPCSIQLVAPKFQDEELLKAAAVIDRDLKG